MSNKDVIDQYGKVDLDNVFSDRTLAYKRNCIIIFLIVAAQYIGAIDINDLQFMNIKPKNHIWDFLFVFLVYFFILFNWQAIPEFIDSRNIARINRLNHMVADINEHIKNQEETDNQRLVKSQKDYKQLQAKLATNKAISNEEAHTLLTFERYENIRKVSEQYREDFDFVRKNTQKANLLARARAIFAELLLPYGLTGFAFLEIIEHMKGGYISNLLPF